MFAGNYAPAGWALCNGSLLSIAEYSPLFNLIGTTYGGNGQSTFALPDLRSRVPVHQGNGYVVGQNGGLETVSLTAAQLPVHTHVPAANSTTTTPSNTPQGNVWANWSVTQYSASAPSLPLAPAAIGNAGSSAPHDNMIPYLPINFIISLTGIYPSQN